MIRRATVRLIAALRRVAGSGGDVAFTVAVGAGYAVPFAVAFLVERGFRDDAVAGSASRSSQVLGFAFYAAVFVCVTVLYGCGLRRALPARSCLSLGRDLRRCGLRGLAAVRLVPGRNCHVAAPVLAS